MLRANVVPVTWALVFLGTSATSTRHVDEPSLGANVQNSQTPGPRSQPILLYDDHLRRVLLFDGAYPSSPGAQSQRTMIWSWNGTEWEALPSSGPVVRYASAAAYDTRRGKIVSYSGRAGRDERITPDTWEWDGSTWTRAASDGPIGRAVTAMVYDGTRRQVVLFDGVGMPNGPERLQPSFGDTWVWEGSGWRKAADDGPRARMAYDAARGRTVLYGGNSRGRVLDDTWEWDGSSWRRVK